MNKEIKIKVISDSKNILFEERENLITHTPFNSEFVLFNMIKEGNTEKLKTLFEDYLSSELVMGRMSKNKIKQVQYWAISTIAVSVHYAILGGLDETDAFNISDECIRYVDTCFDTNDIFTYLQTKAEELTTKVAKAKEKEIESNTIKQAIHYIHINLHRKITLTHISKKFSLSPNYFSTLFKKETGLTLHTYLMTEKVKESKSMLLQGKSYTEIAYNLGFCTESHFISWFHKIFNETPKEYLKKNK